MNNSSDDRYVSLPDSNKHRDFLNAAFKLILDEAVFKGTDRSEPVTRWQCPDDLVKLFNLEPSLKPCDDDELLEIIKKTIQFSVKTGHPRFVNQLFSSLDVYGFIGQLITDSLNSSVYTYEVAPVFTLMEKTVLKTMRSLVGWESGDGIFCPGGSIANGIGINIARFNYDNNIKFSGSNGMPRFVIFASNDAHYSLRKMAALLGLGENNVVLVPTDETGSMNTHRLKNSIEKVINEGSVPIAVVATSGTTVLGAFDPLQEIADICKRYKIWLHVDAAWGGCLLFSKKHRQKLNGLSRADSVTINPHKLLAVPQQCSMLLTQHRNILTDCHAAHASYLFQTDKFYGTDLDCGDAHIQCGRRPDVFKFWLMWKAKGTCGFESHVDTIMETSQYFLNCVKNTPNMKLVCEPQFVNVCFWYLPTSLKCDNIQGVNNIEFKEKLHKIAPKIKERMIRKGSIMLSYQPLGDKPNFFRFVTQNSGLKKVDVDYILNEIDLLGRDL
ncbi:cysteine sulfinic acid decarboxylase-like [Arctopsyche grandis]|uniref:cysteine sulfinic acid decarboxylase-like n=1 Tax=Arctopsyche grandis TaxID=121162 RepID=UPI00406D97D0